MSLESSPIDQLPQILRPTIDANPDGLPERRSSKAAKPLSYGASGLLKGWRKRQAAALCRRSQRGCKAGERRAISTSGIAFTILHISRKPLIAKEICSAIAIHVFFTKKSAIRWRNSGLVPIKRRNVLIVWRPWRDDLSISLKYLLRCPSRGIVSAWIKVAIAEMNDRVSGRYPNTRWIAEK